MNDDNNNANNLISIKTEYNNGITHVKILIRHVMETGQRKNDDGILIPANFIRKLQIFKESNSQILFSVDIGPSISKDPLIAFKTKNLNKADKFSIVWEDHQGKKNKIIAEVKS